MSAFASFRVLYTHRRLTRSILGVEKQLSIAELSQFRQQAGNSKYSLSTCQGDYNDTPSSPTVLRRLECRMTCKSVSNQRRSEHYVSKFPHRTFIDSCISITKFPSSILNLTMPPPTIHIIPYPVNFFGD
jgi:hypothetical protein